MGEVVNTFVKGMDKDTDKAYVSKDSYLDAHNFRVTTTKGNSTGSLETVLGNHWLELEGAVTDDLFTQTDQQIIGAKEIRGKLILFTTNIEDEDPKNTITVGSPRSQIHVATIDLENETISDLTTIYDDGLNHASGGDADLLYFTTAHPIKAVVRYETDDIQRVYWTDTYNNVRTCNIADNLTTDGEVIAYPTNQYISTDKLAFMSEFNMARPEVTAITSGTIPTGVVFYAYQLYYQYGAETVISPMSSAIHVTSSDDILTNTKEYYGDATSTNSGKGFQVHITGLENKYDKLRLIRVHYPTKDTTPTIAIAVERDISPDVDNVYVYDVGETVGELTLDEFNISSTGLFTCEDLAIKDNILFAANITEELFDIPSDYDCRAVRFNSSAEADVYTAAGVVTTISDLSSTYWNDTTFPMNHDAINYYNNIDYDGNSDYEFRYQYTDNTKWGAEGPNITIGFAIEDMELDSAGSIYSHSATSSSSNDVSSYSNFANPVTAGKRSFQRDETYRLYIVFHNNRGQKSFPKWICDLRMPGYLDTIVDHEGNGAIPGSLVLTLPASTTTAYLLYPTITIKNMPTGAISAQVYMLERKEGDRSIITQGVLLPMTYNYESDVNCWGPGICELESYGAVIGTRTYCKPSTDATVPTPITANSHTTLSVSASLTSIGTYASDVLLHRFVSPEVMYTSFSNPITNNAYLEKVTYYKTTSSLYTDYDASYTNTNDSSEHRNTGFYYVKGFNNSTLGSRTTAVLDTVRKNITAAERVDFYDITKKVVGGYTYRNYTGDITWTGWFNNSDMRYGSYGSSCLLITTNAELWDPSVETLPIVNYRIRNFDSQYGGNTFSSRINDTPIPCSDLITEVDTSTLITNGDTFINYFEVVPDMFDLSVLQYTENGGYSTWASLLHIPIESSINLELAHSKSQLSKTLVSSTGVFDPARVQMAQEVAGDYWIYYDHDTIYRYNQVDNLYLYNPVYSQTPIAQSVIVPNPNKILENHFDTKIMASAKKINGEFSDSWTKFGVNEFIEVDSEHGPVNALKLFNNQLFFFQDTAFGIAQVNAQSLIQDSNSAQLVLGTGGILPRFDYASLHVGSMDKFAITTSKAGMYWFDRILRSLFRYTTGVTNLGKSYNIQSYLDNTTNIDLSTDDDGAVSATTKALAFADLQNEEVLFTFDSTTGNCDTLVFNEATDSFTSFYDIDPTLYVSYFNKYITTNVDNYNAKLFIHNSTQVPRCSFYNLDTYVTVPDSTIKILFNPDYAYTKAFDNMYFVSNAYDVGTYGDIEQFLNTFDLVRFYNDHQITDYVELVVPGGTAPGTFDISMPIERRERGWTLVIPRNVMAEDVSSNADIFDDSNYDATQLYKERMRDKYLVADLIYYNTKNTATDIRFNVNHVGLKYRTSIR